MAQFRIYPPIGLARVGNSLTDFYVGPEIPGHPGLDVDSQGNETPVSKYKVGVDAVKRQAARFRLFEVDGSGVATKQAELPAGATVEWSVHLVNKKSAVKRGGSPPKQPTRPVLLPNSADRLIDGGTRSVSGASASGKRFDGTFLGRQVALGEIRTDKNQNLLVLGGAGFSSSPTNAGLTNFYNNTGWHDDVSDGPVTATIREAGGNVITDITPAWVAVGPPDFAPEVQGVVTLFDVIRQIGIDHFQLPAPTPISFTRDVFPLLFRVGRLRWVNIDPNWDDISEDWPKLADVSPAAKPLRAAHAEVVRNTAGILSNYALRAFQKTILDQWLAGTFQSDWAGIPAPGVQITAGGLTRAALDGTVGQGFFPGIEAGIIVTDPTLYDSPFDFRLDHAQAKPGDLTALMALPWQADFVDCNRNWWPSQRPDDVFPQPDAPDRLRWDRGIDSYLDMVHNFSKLAFITAARDTNGNVVFCEAQRAPSSVFS